MLPNRISRDPRDWGPGERVREAGQNLLALLYRGVFSLLTRLLEWVEAGELDWLLDFLDGEEA